MPVKKKINKVDEIIKVLEDNSITITSTQENNGDHIILSDNLMCLYESDDDRFSVSFHIATRPDISAMFIKNIYEDLNPIVCNINVMETHYINKNNDILYGDKALQEYLGGMKSFIIENFISVHKSKILLEDDRIGYHC